MVSPCAAVTMQTMSRMAILTLDYKSLVIIICDKPFCLLAYMFFELIFKTINVIFFFFKGDVYFSITQLLDKTLPVVSITNHPTYFRICACSFRGY